MSDPDVAAPTLAEACLKFFEQRCGKSEVVSFREAQGAAESAEPAARPVELSLTELVLVADPGSEHEHLVLLGFDCPAQAPSLGRAVELRVLTPDQVRGAAPASARGTGATDLPVVMPSRPFDQIAVLVYRWTRNERMRRKVAAVVALVDTLRCVPDADRASGLTSSTLEHLELLDDPHGAEIVLGCRGLRLERVASDEVTSVAVLDGTAHESAGSRLWLVHGQVHEGPDREEARPVTSRNYLLLRMGRRPTRESVRHYIDELRKQHRLRRDELSGVGEGESYEAFARKQAQERKKRWLSATYGEGNWKPVVTPILLDVAESLLEPLALNADSPFQVLLGNMRNDFQAKFGLRIPGITERHAQGSPTGQYTVSLHEVPTVSWNIPLGKSLCSGTVEQFEAQGVRAESASYPDGRPGACVWIAKESVAVAKRDGRHTWDEVGCVVMHLHALIRTNLASFIGIDEVARALVSSGSEELLARISSAAGGLPRFRQAIVPLLDEQVSFVSVAHLAARYLELGDRPSYELSEELRMISSVRAELSRDVYRWRLYLLAEEWQAAFRDGISLTRDGALLALEPEVVQEALAAVREALMFFPIDEHSQRVLLVDDHRVRPLVRKLAELEFPELRVVAQRELQDDVELPPPTAIVTRHPVRGVRR